MDIEKIKVDKKEVGKLVGLGKRAYTNAKKRVLTVIVDQIEDYENDLFAEDYELAKLVKAKQELDKETKAKKEELSNQIIERINNTLKSKRGYDAEELYDKRQMALLELLKDAKEEFMNKNGKWTTYQPDPDIDPREEMMDFGELITRLGNMITELEEV